jgi:hypothetical protein
VLNRALESCRILVCFIYYVFQSKLFFIVFADLVNTIDFPLVRLDFSQLI